MSRCVSHDGMQMGWDSGGYAEEQYLCNWLAVMELLITARQ